MKQAPLCVCMHGSSHMKSVGGRRNKREDEGACTPVRACLCAIVYCSMCVCVRAQGVTGKQKGLETENEREKETGACVCLCVGGRENETGRSRQHVCVYVFVCDCRESISVRGKAGGTEKRQRGRKREHVCVPE